MVDAIQQKKHTVFLLALIIMFLVQPVARGFVGGFIVFDVLITIVLLGVFEVVAKRKHDRWIALAIGIPAIGTRWLVYGLAGDSRWICIAVHQSLVLALFVFAVVVILRDLFEEKVVTMDHVIGTVCGYLLAAAAWGNGYELAQQFVPGSFNVEPEIAWQLDDVHLRSYLFHQFSLCTLTGAADHAIVTGPTAVATLTGFEAMFGHFYMAIVVVQLVHLKLSQTNRIPKQTT